jgi:small subunit ribosomal protein S3Ae
MVEIITRDITSSDLKEVVNKLLPDSIAKDIEKACQGIYPLHDVYIRKVNKLYETYDHLSLPVPRLVLRKECSHLLPHVMQ